LQANALRREQILMFCRRMLRPRGCLCSLADYTANNSLFYVRIVWWY